MNYKEFKDIVRENHLEEFISLLPENAKVESRTEPITMADQMSIQLAEEFAFIKIADKYGYEVDEDFSEADN